MFKQIFLLVVFILGLPAHATETWIQVIGINEVSRDQNYANFYKSSLSFNEACRTKKRNCTSFMDPNADVTNDAESAYLAQRVARDYNTKKASREEILSTIEKALTNAKGNDKIVLSLENHGGPTYGTQEGKSCIYINSKECISDADLKKLFDKHPLPQGAKIAIIASGCFSGGFHDIMSENVCVSTTADQYYVGLSKPPLIWDSIRDGKTKKFSELKDLDYYGQKGYYTSDHIKAERDCENLRQKGKNDLIARGERRLTNLSQTLLRRCENKRLNLWDLEDLKNSLEKNEKTDFGNACKSSENEFACKKIQDVQNLLRSKLALVDTLNSKKRLEDAKNKFQQLNEKIDTELTYEERQYKYYLIASPKYRSETSPNNEAFPKDRLNLIKKSANDYLQAFQTSQKLENEFNAELKKNPQIKLNEIKMKIDELHSCLNENAPDVDSTSESTQNAIQYWERIAKAKDKKKFSDKEIQDAKKCENSFTF